MNQIPNIGLDPAFYVPADEAENAQKELEWKTLMLQDYVENAAIGLHWVDENGIIKWANKAELDMLGYRQEEYIGHHISEFHVKQEKINDILRRLSCNETLQNYESEVRCKNGTIKTVHISSNVFWFEERFIHTRCFTIDITDQKKLLTALAESESSYKNLIHSLSTPLYTTDPDGRITMFNKAAADLWGREPEIGKDMWCGSFKILNDDGSEMALDHCPMAVCLKEKRPVHGAEILAVRPDGSVRHVAPYPEPLFDSKGYMTGPVNMLIDISPIKQTQIALKESEAKYKELAATLEKKIAEKTADLQRKNEQLKRSEERYHKMIDEVEDYAIILLDQNGTVQNWNKGAEKIKGYKEEEIVGKNFSIFYLPEDRDAKQPEKILDEARKHGKALYEGWRIRKDGSRFWGSIVLTALHDEDHRIIGFSKVTRDLTQKKRAEDKMWEYTNQLEFKNKELEQFAFAASHDMKEPLRKISFYVSVVAEKLNDQLDETSAEYLKKSMIAARRMNELIEDLLTYATTNTSEENFEPVDLDEIVEDILLLHKDEIDQKKIHIETRTPGTVRAIPFQMRQLLENLIANSIKYRHSGRTCIIKIEGKVIPASDVKTKQLKIL